MPEAKKLAERLRQICLEGETTSPGGSPASQEETQATFQEAGDTLLALETEKGVLPHIEGNPFRNGSQRLINFLHILGGQGVEEFPQFTIKAWASEAADQIEAYEARKHSKIKILP